MNAKAAPDLIPVARDWTDPETGHRWLHIMMTEPYDYDQVVTTPKIITLDGEVFVRTGWNSDKGEMYYRNNMPVAKG